MTLERALVIGGGGQVARPLVSSLRARGISPVVTSSSGREGALPLDLADPASIRACFSDLEQKLGKSKAEVFLPGALTHVDRCEQERELCRSVNTEGPRLVAEECARRGHFLTFFSTEYVFGEAEYQGGPVGPFSETDPPAPTSWYGACKLEAERAIQRIFGAEGAMIVRTTMVFSWDPSGMNFLMQYLRHLEQRARGGSAVFSVPEDQISTPTYAPSLAEGCCRLRERGFGGVVNLVGSDLLSRRELVERVIASFGFDREEALRGFRFLRTAELGQKARRPLTAGLVTGKAAALGVRIWSLREAFDEIQRLRGASAQAE